FLRFPLVVRAEEQTPQYCSVVLSEGFKATLFAVKREEFPAVLFQAIGSQSHLDKLAAIATKRKLSLTGRGLEKTSASKARGAARSIRIKTEADIYQHLKMQYVPPELREDQGEIEAALAGRLPEDLITTDDVRGMVHC